MGLVPLQVLILILVLIFKRMIVKSIIFIYFSVLILIILDKILPYFNFYVIKSKDEQDFLLEIVQNTLLPLFLIIYIILMVERDRKVTNLKRSAYVFSYYIFLPSIVLMLISNILDFW